MKIEDSDSSREWEYFTDEFPSVDYPPEIHPEPRTGEYTKSYRHFCVGEHVLFSPDMGEPFRVTVVMRDGDLYFIEGEKDDRWYTAHIRYLSELDDEIYAPK